MFVISTQVVSCLCVSVFLVFRKYKSASQIYQYVVGKFQILFRLHWYSRHEDPQLIFFQFVFTALCLNKSLLISIDIVSLGRDKTVKILSFSLCKGLSKVVWGFQFTILRINLVACSGRDVHLWKSQISCHPYPQICF